MKEERVRCIDGIKGMCAIVIAFFVHYQVICKGYFPMHNVFPYLSSRGHFFVEMFFMMSGFCIYSAYGNRIMEHSISFGMFMKKRLSKVYFLHFASTIFCAIFQFGHMLRTGESIFYQNEDVSNLVLNFLLLQSGLIGHVETFNAAAWYLSNVFLCYIVFYLLFYSFKTEICAFYVWGCLAVLSIIILYNLWTVPVFNRFVARGFLSFFIGMLICRLYRLGGGKIKTVIGVFSLLIAIGSYVVYKVSSGWTDYIGNYQLVYSLVVMPAMFLSVLLIKPINMFFSSKPLKAVGNISAELFLLHYPVMYGIKTFDVYLGLNIDYYSVWTYIAYVVICLIVSCFASSIGKYIRRKDKRIRGAIFE